MFRNAIRKFDDFDVLCGQNVNDTIMRNHRGSINYKERIVEHIEVYRPENRRQRAETVNRIITIIENDYGGRFIMRDHTNNTWHEINDRQKRDKISRLFRELIKLNPNQL
jgi:hypothetical protein